MLERLTFVQRVSCLQAALWRHVSSPAPLHGAVSSAGGLAWRAQSGLRATDTAGNGGARRGAMRISMTALAICTLWTGSGTAVAQNLAFMHNSPISFMRDKDLASLTKTLNGVLDSSADGQTTEWTNEGTGNSVPIKGTLTPKDTDDQNGMHCRHLAVTLSAKSQDQSWLPLFCKTAQGWKMQKR